MKSTKMKSPWPCWLETCWQTCADLRTPTALAADSGTVLPGWKSRPLCIDCSL